MMYRLGLIGCCALLAFASLCSAQTPSIQNALDAALQKEREIQQKKNLASPQIELEFSLKLPVDKDGAPLSLGALLDRAVKNNADIRVAESKIRDAEVNLTKTRLVVMQQVVIAHQEAVAAKSNVDRVESMFKQKAVSTESLQKAKAELAKAEAQLCFLLGEQSRSPARVIWFAPDGAKRSDWAPAFVDPLDAAKIWQATPQYGFPTPKQGSQADKLRESLNHLVRLSLTQQSGVEAIEQIRKLMPGVNLTVSAKLSEKKFATVDFKEAVELGAILQWFEDEFGCRFVLRDYGVVVVEADRIPPGAVLVQTFWKTPSTKTSTAAPPK
jgi:hypothetical protein